MTGLLALAVLGGIAAGLWMYVFHPEPEQGELMRFAAAAFVGAVAGGWAALIFTTAWVVMGP